jgi:hypothetical protein
MNSIFFYQLNKGFRLLYELSYMDEKNIFRLFSQDKGGPLPKKTNIFFAQQWQFIRQSKALVELMRNMLFI